MRSKLGESLSTVQKYDIPLEQETTSSLEALHAMNLGAKTVVGGGDSARAIPFYQRAVQIDPNFAMAYMYLSFVYSNIGENRLSQNSMQRAYELRTRVSERERLMIEGAYYQEVTGNLDKARKSLDLCIQTYPRFWVAHDILGSVWDSLGQYDKEITERREAVRLNPADSLDYRALAFAYISLDRLDEANALVKEASTKNLGSSFDSIVYSLAFLQNDNAEMVRQGTVVTGMPGDQDP